jgi:hypothetical protein
MAGVWAGTDAAGGGRRRAGAECPNAGLRIGASGALPDLVADLNGQIRIDLDGRIDSHNRGIRDTFEVVPDAPVSRFVLELPRGKKSLLTNSETSARRARRRGRR